MRLLAATLRKLLLRPATRIVLIVLVALVALVVVSIGGTARTIEDPEQLAGVEAILRFPDAYGSLAAMLVLFGGLGAAAYGASIGGTEWSWGTFRLAVARGESRPRYVVVTVAGIAVLLLLGWLIVFAIGVVLVPIGAALASLEAGDPLASGAASRVPILIAAGWWAVVMQASIGFAVAFVMRSQVAGLVAFVGLYLGEQFASILLPAELLRLAPVGAATSLVTEAGRAGLADALVLPLVMTTVYLGAALVGVASYARRTEVA